MDSSPRGLSSRRRSRARMRLHRPERSGPSRPRPRPTSRPSPRPPWSTTCSTFSCAAPPATSPGRRLAGQSGRRGSRRSRNYPTTRRRRRSTGTTGGIIRPPGSSGWNWARSIRRCFRSPPAPSAWGCSSTSRTRRCSRSRRRCFRASLRMRRRWSMPWPQRRARISPRASSISRRLRAGTVNSAPTGGPPTRCGISTARSRGSRRRMATTGTRRWPPGRPRRSTARRSRCSNPRPLQAAWPSRLPRPRWKTSRHSRPSCGASTGCRGTTRAAPPRSHPSTTPSSSGPSRPAPSLRPCRRPLRPLPPTRHRPTRSRSGRRRPRRSHPWRRSLRRRST